MRNVIKVCMVAIFMLNMSYGFAQNSKELTAIEDATVHIKSRDANYGGEDKIEVKRSGRIINAFVKFDISGHEASINKAIMKLYCVGMENTDVSTGIDVYATENDWSEKTLTYNNAPKPIRKQCSVTVDKKDQYYEFDVTKFVKQQLAAGEKEVSFRLSDQEKTNNSIFFNSKEARKNKPLLIIE